MVPDLVENLGDMPQVIVHLFDEAGVDTASKLDGDFAFVILDEVPEMQRRYRRDAAEIHARYIPDASEMRRRYIFDRRAGDWRGVRRA